LGLVTESERWLLLANGRTWSVSSGHNHEEKQP
jgi:hypothetical protein